MTRSDEAARSTVTSRDGTEIAYRTSGEGPPLLLVHGTAGISDRFGALLPYLQARFTVHAMDRRGRGTSGDAPEYALEREYEDVAAVVDAIAEASGRRVDVYGHSYGGEVAFGAARLTSNIRRLVLYEGWPPVHPEKLDFPREVEERIDSLAAAGKLEEALLTLMRDVVQVPEDDIEAIRAQPSWPARVSTAPTITREIRAFSKDRFDPALAAKVTIPVLVLTGSDSPEEIKDDPEAVAAALPDARVVVIEGQEHIADVLVPEIFAAEIVRFLTESDQGGE